ncbi:MAG: Nif3-like dinuclear metal center hexameric protein [Clostridiales bacterium]|nr:Nif3-like dinuclear metal center hexameric protein [Clostridiales bacterium]
MSYKINDVINVLEDLFPLENAMDYDNPGLLTGNREDSLKKILLTLDCTMDSVKMAIENGCNLIIAHHPIIFGGILSVSYDDPCGKILSELIKNDIALYACHTQLDCTEEFGNIAIAEALGIKAQKLDTASIGVIVETDSYVEQFSDIVKNALNSSGIISLSDPVKPVHKVFIQGGAFDEENIGAIVEAGVDTVLTGEMKHHHMVLLNEFGIATLLCGHNASERIYLPRLKNVLEGKIGDVMIFVDSGKERTLQ